MDSVISFVAADAYIIIVVMGVVDLLLFFRKRWLKLLIATVVIGGIAYLLSIIGTNLISDPRPFIETGKPPTISSSSDNGFPSDHTLLLATVAMLVTLANIRIGIVLWVLALLVGLSRVYVGVHHLLDVIGSLVIVAIAGAIYLLGRYLWLTRSNKNSGSSVSINDKI